MSTEQYPGGYTSKQELIETVYDVCKGIKDPEKPQSLEELGVVKEEDIHLLTLNDNTHVIQVQFTPTVPHCHLAAMIGLSLKLKLYQCLPKVYKIDISIKKETHDTYQELNKQLGDKERVWAAMENASLRGVVDECIRE